MNRRWRLWTIALAVVLVAGVGFADDAVPQTVRVDRAVDNGLRFLAGALRPDGTFDGGHGRTAALPALVGMAFLSKGHLPGRSPYGEVVNRTIDSVLSRADMKPDAAFRGYFGQEDNGRMYAHAIATLFLSECSGMVDARRQRKIDEVLPYAVRVILDAQRCAKDNAEHLGGWRYHPDSKDSDLSCSGWALMALRSARLNGGGVPPEAIEQAVLFIKRTRREKDGAFSYQSNRGQYAETLSGAGILCLELCGRHLAPESRAAARFVRQTYEKALSPDARGYVFYGLYYTAQGLFQIGGDEWKTFYPWLTATWLPKQRPDGSWVNEHNGAEGNPVYATAMMVLALTVPYRQLPIYQRDETVD